MSEHEPEQGNGGAGTDDLLDEQAEQGYGEDEGERDEALDMDEPERL